MDQRRHNVEGGFTQLEFLVVVVIVIVLVGMLVPGGGMKRARLHRIMCSLNLKGIGSLPHKAANPSAFSLAASAASVGSLQQTTEPEYLWRYWLAFSNEPSMPKLLLCPADKERQLARGTQGRSVPLGWNKLTNNAHLSYFLGLNALEDHPRSILAGDRNVTTNRIVFGSGRHVLAQGTVLCFTEAIHRTEGNLLLGDGSVQQVANGRFTDRFQDALKSTGLTTNVWLVP
jgi:hypothetical protein